jgi:hypothetical protein
MHKNILEDVQIAENLTEKLAAFSSILALYISAKTRMARMVEW